MNSLSYYIKHPSKFIGGVFVKFNRLFRNDELYLRIIFRCITGRRLNLKDPQTFTEKLQWLKLYNRQPILSRMVDKYTAKEYAANIVGEQYIIPTLGVWNSVDDIDWEALPQQFVLKTTHGGGGSGVVICKDKSSFDFEKAKVKLRKSMKTNAYHTLREWPYKNIKPRIIAEEYMSNGGEYLNDYKFFCFNGVPKAMLIASGRYVEPQTCFDYYDMDFNHLPFEQGGPNYKKHIEKPRLFEEMKDIAAKLSEGLIHARIDLYDINGNVKFGEITFFDDSGMAEFNPQEWDYIFGSWIQLPTKKHNDKE